MTTANAASDVASPGRAAQRTVEGRIGWLERPLAGITAPIEHAVFTEQHARPAGWLQARPPRQAGDVPGRVMLAAA